MFLSSFEKLRKGLLAKYTLSNLMHMENGVMGIAFGTAVSIFRNMPLSSFNETYHQIKYHDVQNGDPASLPVAGNRYNRTNQTNFEKIPGNPIAYWASQNLIHDFEIGRPLSEYANPRQGLATGENARFLRQWYEVCISQIKFDTRSISDAHGSAYKWFPYNKGGAYRKWYGNYDYVVAFDEENFNVLQQQGNHLPSKQYYFREAITWSLITSGGFSIRYREPGSIHDVSGMSAFSNDHNQLMRIMALLNSPVGEHCFKMLNPTINLQVGNVTVFPVLHSAIEAPTWDSLIQNSVKLTKQDWNSEEQRWGFWTLPVLVHIAEHTVLVICHIHRRISKIRVTAKHPFKKLATWWHKIQNVPKKCQTFGLGGH